MVLEFPRTATPEAHARFGPKIVGPLPGPNARKIVARDEALLSPSYTRCYPWSPSAAAASASRTSTATSSSTSPPASPSTPPATVIPRSSRAIQEQAAELIHMSGTDFYYDHMPRLAERLSAVAPMPGPHRFYFGNSGAEAVECALKLARYHTGRQNIISFFGGFHGRTMGALSLTGSQAPAERRFAPLVPGVTHVRYPYAYRGTHRRPRRSTKPSPSTAPATSKTSSSRPCSRPKRSPPSSSSPSRAKAATSSRPTTSSRRSAASATARHPPRRRRGPVRRRPHRQVVGHRALRRPARHRLHRQGHRLRHASRHLHDARRDHGLGARLARQHLRRQSRLPSPPPSPRWTSSSAKRMHQRRHRRRTACSSASAPGSRKHPTVGDVRGRGLMIGIEIVEDQQSRANPPAPCATASSTSPSSAAFSSSAAAKPPSASALRSSSTSRRADIALDILEECIAIASR